MSFLDFGTGSAKFNLRDTLHEHLTTEQVENLETVATMVLNVVVAMIPGGTLLKVIDSLDNYSNVAMTAGIATQRGRGYNEKDLAWAVAPDTEGHLKQVMVNLRNSIKPDLIQKMFQEDYGQDYQQSINETYPRTPLMSELKMLTPDVNGNGMFSLQQAMDDQFAATVMLRKFYSAVVKLDMANKNDVAHMTAIWNAIRQAAEDAPEQHTHVQAFTGTDSAADQESQTAAILMLCCACCCVFVGMCSFFLCAAVVLI
jgi:hypothetical protein